MLKSYLLLTWRQIWRNKTISLINIGGLSTGIACSILLLSYVSFQLGYDSFHTNKNQIYRVGMSFSQDHRLVAETAETYSAIAPAIKKEFPEVLDAARLYNMGYKNNCVFSYGDLNFKETKFMYSDPSLLTIFSFPLIQGDPRSALTQPFTAVISESMAHKLFGDQYLHKAMGESILMNDDDRHHELCKITGICKDIPENSHLKFNILISYSTLLTRNGGSDRYDQNWTRKDYYTYLLLRPGADPLALENKLPAFVRSHQHNTETAATESRLSLQPLQQIHLSNGRTDEPEPTLHAKAITFLMIIAFFIITIAWINYINLATASGVGRAREIGIRKVLGSRRSQLVRQFFVESFILNFISFIIAILLVQSLQPFLYNLFAIHFSTFVIFTSSSGLVFLGFLLLGTFFSGLYPALVLSGYNPILVLKGKFTASAKGLFLRQSLVVFQFSLSILLIIGTLVVYKQVRYMLSRDIGIRPDQVLVLDRPGRWDTARSTHNGLVKRFKETLLNNPGIASIAMSDEIPGKEIRWPSTFTLKNNPSHPVLIQTTMVDQGFIPTLGMNILAGRNFSDQYPTDKNGVLLTLSAARDLGFAHAEAAVGAPVRIDNDDYHIVGIVNDYNQLSLQKEASPAAFTYNGNDLREFEYYLIKLKKDHIASGMDQVSAAWSASFLGNPFQASFLDEFYNRQYQHDIQFGILFALFSFLTILVACIGLIALVAFMVRQRTREIGIRKILGARVREILFLLTKDFAKLVLLANVIAWPLGWLLMNSWLKDFAYRIHLHWLLFLLAGLTALFIALFTISFQAIRAALINPAKSLREP